MCVDLGIVRGDAEGVILRGIDCLLYVVFMQDNDLGALRQEECKGKDKGNDNNQQEQQEFYISHEAFIHPLILLRKLRSFGVVVSILFKGVGGLNDQLFLSASFFNLPLENFVMLA